MSRMVTPSGAGVNHAGCIIRPFPRAPDQAPWKPNASTSSPHCSPTSKRGPPSCGGIFDFEKKKSRLDEVARQLEDPAVWNDQKHAQELGREKKSLDTIVGGLEAIASGLADSRELFELSRE